MEAQGPINFSPSADEEPRWAQPSKSKGNIEQSGHGSSDVKYPPATIIKWWIIITLAADAGILVFACVTWLPVLPLFENILGRVLTEMLILASTLTRAGGIGLFVFASNAYLLGRILYHRCSKTEQLEESASVRAVGFDMGIKAWTILIILIDVAAIVFPLLTMYMRHPGTEGSHAAGAGELYPSAGSASGLTADQLLLFFVFLWTIIFLSNTLLLIRSLFHQCNLDEPQISEAL